MSVSTKELFTAFFKGLAFAKGLNFGDEIVKQMSRQ